jgi:hypothetical protein
VPAVAVVEGDAVAELLVELGEGHGPENHLIPGVEPVSRQNRRCEAENLAAHCHRLVGKSCITAFVL